MVRRLTFTGSLLFLAILGGCLGHDPPAKPFELVPPPLELGMFASYRVSTPSGSTLTFNLTLSQDRVVTAEGDWLEGFVVEASQQPAPPPHQLGEPHPPQPLGLPTPVRFGLDDCLLPLWAHDVARSHVSFGFYGEYPPPFLLAAGRTFVGHREQNYSVQDLGFLPSPQGPSIPVGEFSLGFALLKPGKLFAEFRGSSTWSEWTMEYEPGVPFPTLVQASAAGYHEMRLLEWRHGVHEVRPCPSPPPREEGTAKVVPVTDRATGVDPPVPFSLREAIQRAEASEELRQLAAFMRAHPDAYIESWVHAKMRGISLASGPGESTRIGRWQLQYSAPGGRASVLVTCDHSAVPAQGPVEVRITCSESAMELEHPSPSPDYSLLAIPKYETWVENFPELFGAPPEVLSYRISSNSTTESQLNWWEDPAEQEPLAPATWLINHMIDYGDYGALSGKAWRAIGVRADAF